ncbi:hypothetical protein U9M48_042155 [Paspalum notatum var. saurae]|uniref:Uncharacterized protein n=1 Tax=Paspalum notatum var. saurae TaxID=547442 RepID=A0AAQ3UQJ2_PASNO
MILCSLLVCVQRVADVPSEFVENPPWEVPEQVFAEEGNNDEPEDKSLVLTSWRLEHVLLVLLKCFALRIGSPSDHPENDNHKTHMGTGLDRLIR